MVEFAPALLETAPSVDLSASEDTHSLAHSIRIEPPPSSLSNLPGLRKLEYSLLVSPASKQATTEDARPSTLLDHTPQVIPRPETAPQRQGSVSNDSVRSNEAVFGDTHNSMNDTLRIAPNQPENSLVEIPAVQKASVQDVSAKAPQLRLAPVQATPVQNIPVQVQFPLISQSEKKVEVPKLAIPEPTPAPPKGTPLQYPGALSPPLASSPQIKLLGLQNAQQKTPVMPPNLFLSPSPMMVVPALGSPSSSKPPTPITPNTPIMPPTPIKHQGRIPGVTDQTPEIVANQPPALLPRSPRRPPPPGLAPVSTATGENNFGVIGDRRLSNNQPQPQVVGESKDGPESKEDVPFVKLEPTHTPDEVDGAQDPEGRNSGDPQPIERNPEPIYVGEQRYYVGRHLGGGSMGKVYSVISSVTTSLSALKVTKRKNLDWDDFSTVKSEWAILKAISEAKFMYAKRAEGLQFVHHLLESWYDENHIYFVMVYSVGFFTNLVIDNQLLQPLCVVSLGHHFRIARFDPLTIRVYAAELVR